IDMTQVSKTRGGGQQDQEGHSYKHGMHGLVGQSFTTLTQNLLQNFSKNYGDHMFFLYSGYRIVSVLDITLSGILLSP
ncbi:hypothetical protein ACJX0J_036742, partial [Zea mays]